MSVKSLSAPRRKTEWVTDGSYVDIRRPRIRPGNVRLTADMDVTGQLVEVVAYVIDWAALGYDDHTIDELVEFLLRIIQSMVVAPADPPRSSAELRAYLHRWIGPALT